MDPLTKETKREYMVVETISIRDLEDLIDGYLAKGWAFVGGVAVTVTGDDNYHYFQAMVGEDMP
jgi:predicted chitinase